MQLRHYAEIIQECTVKEASCTCTLSHTEGGWMINVLLLPPAGKTQLYLGKDKSAICSLQCHKYSIFVVRNPSKAPQATREENNRQKKCSECLYCLYYALICFK